MSREPEHETDRQLLARYARETGEMPPEALDAAILAASRRAVRARPAAVWRRWQMPLSLAAAVLVGFGLRHVLDPAEAPGRLPAETASVAPAAEPARLNVAAAERERRQIGRTVEALTRSYRMEEADAAGEPGAAEKSRVARVAAPVADATPGSARAAAPAPVGMAGTAVQPPATAQAAAPPDPAARLEEIRRLLAERRVDEALARLEAFRREFPDYGR